MEPQRPPEDARFEGIGDWLVSHGQDALARGAGRRPTGAGSGRARVRRMARILVGVAAVAVLAWIILSAVSASLAGYLWFSNVGFGDVWGTQFTYGLALFLGGFVGGAVILLASLVLAWRLGHDPSDAAVAARLPGRRTDRSARARVENRRPVYLRRQTCRAGRSGEGSSSWRSRWRFCSGCRWPAPGRRSRSGCTAFRTRRPELRSPTRASGLTWAGGCSACRSCTWQPTWRPRCSWRACC